MKITLLALTLLLGFNTQIAQSHEIVKHDGEKQKINFIKQENNIIYYSNPGSPELKEISTYAVSTLKKDASSEQVTVSRKVTVASKSDYNKVKVLESENQASGLKKATTFTGQWNKTKGISPNDQFKNTVQSIKHRVASEGYSFVTINKLNNGTYEAIAYTY